MTVINKKTQLDEIRRCNRDPLYFINAYVKVSHAIRGTIPFATYPFQDDCIRAFLANRFVIVNKSRQLGLSTIAAAYATWLLIFHMNKEILIMATKLAVAMNFIRKVKQCIDGLPPWLVLPKIEKNNEQSLVMGPPSRSRITAIATSTDAGRSEALSLLIVDEAAHVHDFEELWKGLYPTLSCIVGGTKVLMDDGFHDIEELCGGRAVGEYFGLEGNIYGKDGLEPISHGYVSPEGETRRLKTRRGLELEVTQEHPLWLLDAKEGGRMVPAQDVQVGDYVRVQHSMGIYGNDNSLDHPTVKELTPELAYLVGGYIAEGWCSRGYTVTVSNTDDDFRRAYLENTVIKPFVPAQNHKLICYSKEMVELFKLIGVDPAWKCDTKRVPRKIWRASKDVIAAFLRGYFDGYGCAGGNGVGACSTSRTLLADIHQLLLNMGFIPRIVEIGEEKRRKLIGTYIGENKNPVWSVRPAWTISIPRSQSKKFLDEVGFGISRKRDKLAGVGAAGDKSKGKFLSRIPLSDDIRGRIAMIEKESGQAHSWFCHHGAYVSNNSCGSVTSGTLQRFSALLKEHQLASEKDLAFLDELVGGDYFWDEVVGIERSRALTYDFTVPRTHSFLQNCVLGSNTGGRALIISTPKGTGTWFHKLWKDASSGVNEFHPIQLPWNVHPERDQVWFDHESANMSPKAVAQELMCDFLASGDTYLEASDIAWVGQMVRPPLFRDGPDKGVWVWEHPVNDPGFKYIIPADVSSGSANDFSTFHVICTTTGTVVAEFQGKLRPDLLAKLLLEYAHRYNNALICPERNSYGHHVIVELVNSGYTNIYFEEKKGVYIGNYIPPDRINEAGFSMQRDSRKRVISKLEEVLRNKQLRVFSSRLYDELKTFVTHNDKPQAQKNCHDDLVIALAIGTWLFDASNVHSQFASQLNTAMLQGFGVSVNEFSNMEGSGNEVIPSWVGMVPYIGDPGHAHNARRVRPKADDPSNFAWLFR